MGTRYVRQTWTDGPSGGTPVSGARLAAIENGIFNVDNRPAARVYNSANIVTVTATSTRLTFDSERFDSENIHSVTVNTGRLTCQTAGVYLIDAHATFAANATGGRQLEVRLNGVTPIGLQTQTPSSAALAAHLACSSIYSLAVNDYVEAWAYQESGVNLNVIAAANYSPEFSMVLVG